MSSVLFLHLVGYPGKHPVTLHTHARTHAHKYTPTHERTRECEYYKRWHHMVARTDIKPVCF